MTWATPLRHRGDGTPCRQSQHAVTRSTKPSNMVLTLVGAIDDAQIASLCGTLRACLEPGGAEVVTCDARCAVACFGSVGVLARLQLIARARPHAPVTTYTGSSVLDGTQPDPPPGWPAVNGGQESLRSRSRTGIRRYSVQRLTPHAPIRGARGQTQCSPAIAGREMGHIGPIRCQRRAEREDAELGIWSVVRRLRRWSRSPSSKTEFVY